jgi:phospholipase D-like protein
MPIPLLVLVLLCGVSVLGLLVFRSDVRRAVPRTARLLALLAFAASWLCFALFLTAEHQPPLFEALLSLAGSLFAAAYVLALGYVYGDARRRGMSPTLWVLAAVLVPNLVGFLLYFLLRQPLLEPCGGCGRGMAAGQAFCPACGQPAQARPPAVMT